MIATACIHDYAGEVYATVPERLVDCIGRILNITVCACFVWKLCYAHPSKMSSKRLERQYISCTMGLHRLVGPSSLKCEAALHEVKACMF